MPTPCQPDPDRHWPSYDDPQPGVSIRPLTEPDLAHLLAHFGQHHQDSGEEALGLGGQAPVVAVRVRASVGRPGASAQVEYRRRRAVELAAWTRSLPWRATGFLAAGLVGGLLAAQLAPRLAGPAGLATAAALAWALRFRISADTLAWRRGAAGERRTARVLAPLERYGWAVLHDLAIPGSQANIDHLVIGPGGVVVIDSKQHRGRLRLDRSGLLWHGRHLLSMTLRKVLWEADQADEVLGIADVQVTAIIAIHGASVPWGRLQVDGVTIIPARRMPHLLRALPPILGPERAAWLADRARLRFRPAG
jgi:Nuclease-related domain